MLNSKPLAFKRHDLSRLVGGTLFITYDVNEPDHGRTARVVLEDCGPAGIVRNQPPERVVALLNSSEVGLILSAAEGACYASLEYLLCGLPVVSTPSLGGRDAFYDAANAIIVEPKAEAVRDGVALALRQLREGEMDREAIRREAVARMAGFRRVLAGEVARILEGHGRRVPDGMAWLTDLLRRDSKLREHRNFWVQEVEAA
ncbi:glycosyltransferase [Pseudoroseomonas sp. WGS1072]|uniref:glycosyltransferase n=1 Tax=Roseomonas sp. WGS1072 TaxID=3366816 RepID=UPI003BEFBCFD